MITKAINARVSVTLWKALKALARANGRTVTGELEKALRNHVASEESKEK
jgi:hypothetical protein